QQKNRAYLVESLGDLWPVLEPYAVKEVAWGDEEHAGLRLFIEAEQIGLVGFQIEAHTSRAGRSVVASRNKTKTLRERQVLVTEKTRFGEFLKDCRDSLPAFLKEKHGERVGEAYNALYSAQTGEDADAALARLVELEPARESDWRRHYQHRLKEIERQRKEEEKAQRFNEAKSRAKSEYRAALQSWRAEYESVLSRNRERVGELQRRLDDPFTVLRLTYALIAQDEESRMVETAKAFIFDMKGTHWPTWTGSKIEHRCFLHPVYVTGEIETRPTEKLCAASIFFPDAGATLYFNPHLSREEVKSMIELESLPAMPAAPAELSSYEADCIHESVERNESPDESEIPFRKAIMEIYNHEIIEESESVMAACNECGHRTRFTTRVAADSLRAALVDHNREHAIPCADELAAALCRATGESDYSEISEDAKEFFRAGARAVVKEFLKQTDEAFFRFNSLATDVAEDEDSLKVKFFCFPSGKRSTVA
ncbi:MAG: hypothetical protein AB1631_34600, partial [Acidobacteriota bacterium]